MWWGTWRMPWTRRGSPGGRFARRHGGRPVKWLGDGVMFHFPQPAGAVTCALDLIEEAPAAGMPPAHVGVNAGPVIFRDGDYFGRTVNVAARIAAYAGPGQVLVSDEVIEAGPAGAVAFEEIGPVALKGVALPVRLHRAVRASVDSDPQARRGARSHRAERPAG